MSFFNEAGSLRTHRIYLLATIFLWFIGGLAPPATSTADDEVGRIEIHTFDSITLSDQEFLQGSKSGPTVTLAGELRLPRQKMQQYPAVLLIHGSGGVSGYVDDWAKHLNSMGVATFIVDSFTGRGLTKVNNDQSLLGRLAMIEDVYRALDVLAAHKMIDANKIALMGFSRGGQVALYSSLKRFQQLQGTGSGNSFAAYLAFYPACGTKYKDDDTVADKPIRIFHGTADNYNLVAPCRNFVKRLQTKGADVELYEYDGAHHVFDYKKLVKPFVLKKAQTTRNCVLVESDNGTIVNATSGKPFTYSDACVEYGPTIAYDAEAHQQARQTLTRLLDKQFQLKLATQE